MELGLSNKVALVTGGSMGIGRGIALALGREGCRLAICARNKDPLDEAAKEITDATGAEVLAIPADLTKPEDAEAFVAKSVAHFGRIDILVNNAGSAPGGVIDYLSEADWEVSLQLKFMGFVRCLKHVLPVMQKQKWGRVINLIAYRISRIILIAEILPVSAVRILSGPRAG